MITEALSLAPWHLRCDRDESSGLHPEVRNFNAGTPDAYEWTECNLASARVEHWAGRCRSTRVANGGADAGCGSRGGSE